MLDEKLKHITEEELQETEETRVKAIKELTAWIKNQSELPHFTDSKWLLSFLRVSKFSQDQARSRLKKYWKSRRSGIMKAMNFVDPASPNVLDILRGPHFVYIPLPGCDKEGRQIILAIWKQLDTSGQTYTFKEWFRATNLLFDTLCFLDENVMFNGVTFLMDATGLALRHLTFFGFQNSIQQFEVMQGGYPIRIKQVHYFKNNTVVSLLFNIVKKVMSTKLANRIQFHGNNMTPFYENVDMSILPDEYLPDDYHGPRAGSCSQIMERFIQEKILDKDNLRFLRGLYKCELNDIEPAEDQFEDCTGNICDSLEKVTFKDTRIVSAEERNISVSHINETFYDCV